MTDTFMKRFFNVFATVMPWVIIAALLYAAIFIKPPVVVENLPEPALGRRDFYYGMTIPVENTIWLAGTWGKVIRSDDGGATWTIQPTPVRVNLQAIHSWDGQRAVAAGNEGVFIRTDDGGQTWTEIDNVPKSADRNKIFSLRGRPNGEAWAVGFQNMILKTTDYGQTWKWVSREADLVWSDVAFAGDRVYLVGERGITRYSDDGGETWVDGQAPVEQTLNAVKFRDEKHGVAVGGQGDVLYTNDGGLSWTKAPIVTDKHLYDVAWLGDHWFAVGDKGRHVEGEGDTWTEGRLAIRDLGWHTRIVVKDDAAYLTGASVGVWKDKAWNRFTDKGVETVE